MTILNGWKEIANHMGRGVRTVQRWEHLGCPVRRPAGRPRSAVFAVSEEIDEWLRHCQVATLESDAGNGISSNEISSEVLEIVKQRLAEHRQLILELRGTLKELVAASRQSAAMNKDVQSATAYVARQMERAAENVQTPPLDLPQAS